MGQNRAWGGFILNIPTASSAVFLLAYRFGPDQFSTTQLKAPEDVFQGRYADLAQTRNTDLNG